jgi:hypothetical protein
MEIIVLEAEAVDAELIAPEGVAFDVVGGREISTVKLNSLGIGYETCIFYQNGDSQVVAAYYTLEDALAYHKWIVMHEFMHMYWKNPINYVPRKVS